MDILVHSKDKSKAGEIVSSMGYQLQPDRQGGRHPFHREYCMKSVFPLFLELHWELENEQLVDFPEEAIWQRAQPLELQGTMSRTLSPEDNLIFLANHCHKHVEQQLKLLCDISELLKKYQDTLDWEYIVNSASSLQSEAGGLRRAEKSQRPALRSCAVLRTRSPETRQVAPVHV